MQELEVIIQFLVLGQSNMTKWTGLPVESGRISQACWDTGRLRLMDGPPWTRPLKSTTASEQFYHPEREEPSLREQEQTGSGRQSEVWINLTR